MDRIEYHCHMSDIVKANVPKKIMIKERIGQMMTAGMNNEQIIGDLSMNGISADTARLYIKEVEYEMSVVYQRNIEYEAMLAVQRMRDIAEKAKQVGNLKAQIEAEKEVNKLMGLYPSKREQTTKTGTLEPITVIEVRPSTREKDGE